VKGIAEMRRGRCLRTEGGRRMDRGRGHGGANRGWAEGVVVWVRRPQRGGGVRRVVAVAVVGHDGWGSCGGMRVYASVGRVDGGRGVGEGVS
jgi:hypothetical protein